MIWSGIRSAFLIVMRWTHIVLYALFNPAGKLYTVLPVVMIGFAIVLFVLIMKFIRNTTWGG